MSIYRAKRGRRGHRGMRFLMALVILLIVAGVVYLVVEQRVVVPGLTGRVYPIHYRERISQVAERYDVDPYLIAAVMRTESGYDPRAVSHVGAVGLMQLMPDTAAWIVQLSTWRGVAEPELTDPDDNIELGTCYLAFLIEHFGDNRRAAVAAYNAGQGVVAQWVAAAGGEVLALDDIRFPETRAFVERVRGLMESVQTRSPRHLRRRGGERMSLFYHPSRL